MTIFNLELKKNVSSLQTLKSKQNDFIIVKKATPKFRFLQTEKERVKNHWGLKHRLISLKPFNPQK